MAETTSEVSWEFAGAGAPVRVDARFRTDWRRVSSHHVQRWQQRRDLACRGHDPHAGTRELLVVPASAGDTENGPGLSALAASDFWSRSGHEASMLRLRITTIATVIK
jgi:hypothetical protein